jgi:hypothetical protein
MLLIAAIIVIAAVTSRRTQGGQPEPSLDVQ